MIKCKAYIEVLSFDRLLVGAKERKTVLMKPPIIQNVPWLMSR